MPVYVNEMTTETEVYQGDLPLNPDQIERLVRIVLKRLDERARDAQWQREATEVRNTSAPRSGGCGDCGGDS